MGGRRGGGEGGEKEGGEGGEKEGGEEKRKERREGGREQAVPCHLEGGDQSIGVGGGEGSRCLGDVLGLVHLPVCITKWFKVLMYSQLSPMMQ